MEGHCSLKVKKKKKGNSDWLKQPMVNRISWDVILILDFLIIDL